jgi:predicted NBD/HSP70 family sugar kinase
MTVRHGSARSKSRNPGSQSALRQSNQQRVIRTLLGNGPSTQAELARQTGLSTATISNIVRGMIATGLATTSPVTSSGRRALSVRLAGNGAVSVGIDFGRSHLRIVIATLDYRIIGEELVPLPVGHLSQDAIEVAVTLLDTMLVRNAIAPDAVLGVGIGIPGPIDRRTGTVVAGAILPEWVGITLGDLAERFDFPVYMDNDADLGALAEVTWGPHGGVANLTFIKIGTGIGAGLILGGAQYRGNIGVTGEIGHTLIHEHGLMCRCGNRGCLETVASTSIMIELLSRSRPAARSTGDIVRNALDGDPATLTVVDDAGLAVGRSLSTIVNLLNPAVIVIGGPLAGLGDVLLEPIRRGMQRYAVPEIVESTELVMSALGDRAEALGAAALVLQQAGIRGIGL